MEDPAKDKFQHKNRPRAASSSQEYLIRFQFKSRKLTTENDGVPVMSIVPGMSCFKTFSPASTNATTRIDRAAITDLTDGHCITTSTLSAQYVKGGTKFPALFVNDDHKCGCYLVLEASGTSTQMIYPRDPSLHAPKQKVPRQAHGQ